MLASADFYHIGGISLSFVHMSKLRPVPNKKVPVDLGGWVAVAESPHWFAWPDGPTTKNEQCSPAARMQIFGSKSKKGSRGVFLQGGVFIWHAWRYFSQGKGLFLQQGRKIAIKWLLFAHVYEPLCQIWGCGGLWVPTFPHLAPPLDTWEDRAAVLSVPPCPCNVCL